MAEGTLIYRDPKLKRATGGYIVEYSVHMKAKDAYEGMRYIKSEIEIFKEDEGEEALERLDEIHEMSEESKVNPPPTAKKKA